MNGRAAWWSDRYGGFCVWRTGAFCWAGNPIKTQPVTDERMKRAYTVPMAYKGKKKTGRHPGLPLTPLHFCSYEVLLPLGQAWLSRIWSPMNPSRIDKKQRSAKQHTGLLVLYVDTAVVEKFWKGDMRPTSFVSSRFEKMCRRKRTVFVSNWSHIRAGVICAGREREKQLFSWISTTRKNVAYCYELWFHSR